MAMNLHDCGIPYNGSFRVLSKILTYDYLWNEVRVQGGAYGIRAIFTNLRVLDMLLLSSYRDPHVKRTYETFRNIVSYLRRFSPDESEMTKYVIGAVSMLDAPTRPAQSAYLADLRAFAGLSDERMQQYREETMPRRSRSVGMPMYWHPHSSMQSFVRSERSTKYRRQKTCLTEYVKSKRIPDRNRFGILLLFAVQRREMVSLAPAVTKPM